MKPIFQCAPNFSEGRDPETLRRLQDAARVEDAALADFSADPDHNRCVVTLLGGARGLEAAALRMAAVAVERIDLRRHAGQHPRIGALDVLPFIPLRGAEMAEADALARRVGERLWNELGVPVYLYAHSAAKPERAALPHLRRGGWEALPERLRQLPPDFGSAVPHPSAGVTVVGARAPLLAFNVALNTDDVAVARRIARRLREAGGGARGVRALGLLVDGRAQVSVNITDTNAASLASVFRAVEDMARADGVAVHGSELIGAIALPFALQALNEALRAAIRPEQVLDAWLPPLFPPYAEP